MSMQRKIDETCEAAALYALGCLPPDEAQRFEMRLKSGCPLCTAQAAESREVAEALAAAPTPRKPPASLQERLLASLSSTSQPTVEKPEAERIVVRQDDTPWDSTPLPGVDVRALLGDKTSLVRLQPGAQIPSHKHRANEQCLVIEGSITDADGLTARAGDFVFMPVGSRHPLLHSDTGCVLLIAYT